MIQENKMFCFQCEQTAGCRGCTSLAGVCGKQADTARLQDQLTGALIGLARACEGNEDQTDASTERLILEGLFTTVTNVNFDNAALEKLLERVKAEKRKMVPDCFTCASPCPR